MLYVAVNTSMLGPCVATFVHFGFTPNVHHWGSGGCTLWQGTGLAGLLLVGFVAQLIVRRGLRSLGLDQERRTVEGEPDFMGGDRVSWPVVGQFGCRL